MKIIVAGGRDFADREFMQSTLSNLTENSKLPEYVELVCGMAKGADLLAKDMIDYMKKLGKPVYVFNY